MLCAGVIQAQKHIDRVETIIYLAICIMRACGRASLLTIQNHCACISNESPPGRRTEQPPVVGMSLNCPAP